MSDYLIWKNYSIFDTKLLNTFTVYSENDFIANNGVLSARLPLYRFICADIIGIRSLCFFPRTIPRRKRKRKSLHAVHSMFDQSEWRRRNLWLVNQVKSIYGAKLNYYYYIFKIYNCLHYLFLLYMLNLFLPKYFKYTWNNKLDRIIFLQCWILWY